MVELLEEAGFDTNVFELTIYESDPLHDRHGRDPEETVAGYFADALRGLGVNFRIYHDFFPVDIGNEQAVCGSGSAYDDWGAYLENEAPFVAEDANLLLTNARAGGCGAIGGNVCIAAAGPIDREYTNLFGTAPWSGAVFGALHEIGHNMDFQHGNNPDADPRYRLHPGNTWVADGSWNRTPNVGNVFDEENLCGREIEPKPTSGTCQDGGDCPPNYECHDYDGDGTKECILRTRNWLFYEDCVGEMMKNTALPPVVQVTNLDADTNMAAGEPAEIEVVLGNRTPVDEAIEVDVIADPGTNEPEVDVATIQTTVPATGTTTETVTWTPPDDGTWTIEAGGLSITRSVGVSGDVNVVEMDATPSEPVVGDVVSVSVAVRNTTHETATRSVDVIADQGPNRPEEVIETLEFSVPAGEKVWESTNWWPSEATTYTLKAGGLSIQVPVSGDTGRIRVANIDVATDSPRVGEATPVTIEAENTGSTSLERTVAVEAQPGGQIGTVEFNLRSGETAFRSVTWTPSEAGDVTVTAGNASTAVTVEEGEATDPIEPPGVDLWPALPGVAAGTLFLLARPEDPR